jgi:hypothetical protein
MQYLLYCVVCFEVFVVDVVDATLANHGDSKVASMWYKKVNGIASASSRNTY